MNRRNTPVTARVGIAWNVYAKHRETALFVERLVNRRELFDENMHGLGGNYLSPQELTLLGKYQHDLRALYRFGYRVITI